MAQIKFLADLTQNSPVLLAAAGVDLSAAVGRTAFFTRSNTAINYDVGAVTLAGNGRWQVALTAPYAQASAGGVPCVLHFSFTASGVAYPEPGDTEWPAIARRQAQSTDNLTAIAAQNAVTLAAASFVNRLNSMAQLRAVSPNGLVDGARFHTAGYFFPGDGGGLGFFWRAASTLPDNLGTIIRPSAVAVGDPGRFEAILDSPGWLNALWFGAKLQDIYSSAQGDSAAALNAAVSALPILNYTSVPSPGAGGSGGMRQGTLYLPNAGQSSGYLLSDTLYCSAGVSLIGDEGGFGPYVRLIPGCAADPAKEKWVCFYLPTGGSGAVQTGSPSNSFFAQVRHVHFMAGTRAENAGGSGLYFHSANASAIENVEVAACALRGMVVNTSGVWLNSIWINGLIERGPGLTLIGGHIAAGHLSVEHINSGTLHPQTSAYGFQTDPSIANYYQQEKLMPGQRDYPALLIQQAGNVHIQEIQCEISRVGVRVQDSGMVQIGSISCNLVETGLLILGDSYGISCYDSNGVNMVHRWRDISGSGGAVHDVTEAGGRSYGYTQIANIDTLLCRQASVDTLSLAGKPFPVEVVQPATYVNAHKKLRLTFSTPNYFDANVGTILVSLAGQTAGGSVPRDHREASILIQAGHWYFSTWQPIYRVLEGSQVGVRTVSSSDTTLVIDVGLSLSATEAMQISARHLAPPGNATITAQLLDEDDAAYNNGTATGTLDFLDLPVLAAAPAHRAGRIYYDSSTGHALVSNGSIWKQLDNA